MDGNTSSAEGRQTLLVLRAQSGDRSALDRILQTHQDELFEYLTKMLGNHSDAEDALQASLLQASRKLGWLREPSAFRAWLFRIASRIAYKKIRLRNRSREISNAVSVDEAWDEVAITDGSDNSELVAQIPAWINSLTLKGREAVVLHYLKGFTTEQVAEILDIPVGTVRSRISYSLARIRKQIAQQKETTDD